MTGTGTEKTIAMKTRMERGGQRQCGRNKDVDIIELEKDIEAGIGGGTTQGCQRQRQEHEWPTFIFLLR